MRLVKEKTFIYNKIPKLDMPVRPRSPAPCGFELHNMRRANCPEDVPVAPHHRTPWYKVLYVQVVIAIGLGIVIGHFYAHIGVTLKPLGDVFVALIKMMIAPVIFCTIVHGIGSMSDLKSVGRVAIKALIYFEVVSTLALAIGLIVGELVKPGQGFNIDPATLDPKAVAGYVTRAKEEGFVAHLLAIVPESFVGGLASGDILQVLLVSILTGVTVAGMGSVGQRITSAVGIAGKMFFRLIGIVVRFAPIGAFGAMAFTIGAYGVGSLVNLGGLIATFYATSLLFLLVVLGLIAQLSGFSIVRFIAYIKDELLIVLGTSSSESPPVMRKRLADSTRNSVKAVSTTALLSWKSGQHSQPREPGAESAWICSRGIGMRRSLRRRTRSISHSSR